MADVKLHYSGAVVSEREIHDWESLPQETRSYRPSPSSKKLSNTGHSIRDVAATIVTSSLPVICASVLLISINKLHVSKLAGQGKYGCDASGNVWVEGVNWSEVGNIWIPSYAFRITLGFGRMSFDRAKFVDVMWDLLAGRGFQFLAVIFTYRQFRPVLVSLMKDGGLTQDQVLAFQYSTVSLSTLPAYVKGCYRSGRKWYLRASVPFLVLVVTVVYVLLLPTFLSAMTGYEAFMEPYLRLSSLGNDTVPFSQLTHCWVGIIDGDRVGLPNNECLLSPTGPLANAIQNYTISSNSLKCYPNTTTVPLDPAFDDWNRYSLPPLSTRCDCNNPSKFYYNNKTYHLPSPILDLTQSAFQLRNQTILGTELVETGLCELTGDYQWGFSFFLFYIFAFITLFVSILWCSVALIWSRRTRPDQMKQIFSPERTFLIVADSLRDSFDNPYDEKSDRDLLHAIKQHRVRVEDVRELTRAERRWPENSDFPVGSKQYYAYLNYFGGRSNRRF